jgi:16S rRNA (uracil1498-N3)-methyltransferase
MHRFFAPALDPGDDFVTLPRDEAEHLTRVMRVGVGDTVAVFDGRGHEFLAKVATAVRRDVRVQLVSRIEPAAEAAVPLTLVQAVLKGDTMDDVVRDAVMMGVAAVQPVVTKRSETTVAALLRSAKVDRWRRVAIASVKQSRRAVVQSLSILQTMPPPSGAEVLIGPEGGWTEAECAAAHGRGIRLVTLGHRTLRADAVAVAAISVLQFLWGDL